MAFVLVTGSAGLIGAETARFFHAQGYRILGVDNDMRREFFGADDNKRDGQYQYQFRHADTKHVYLPAGLGGYLPISNGSFDCEKKMFVLSFTLCVKLNQEIRFLEN